MKHARITASAAALALVGSLGFPAMAYSDERHPSSATVNSVLESIPEAELKHADASSKTTVHTEGASQRISMKNSSLDRSLDINIDATNAYSGTDDGFALFTDSANAKTTMFNATANGGQAIFTAQSDAGSRDFTFELDKKIQDISDLGNGRSGVRFTDGTSVSFEVPTAYDQDAQPLETSLSFEGNTVHQRLESTNVKYPVTASAAWTYSYSFNLYDRNPARVRTLMKTPTQFGKIFPVAGAPANFPSPGQNSR